MPCLVEGHTCTSTWYNLRFGHFYGVLIPTRLSPATRTAAMSLPLQPLTDAERFDGLCAGLEAAKLHHVARAVRAERSALDVASHSLYCQRFLAGRGDANAPIYVTPPSAHGARRCTISGSIQTRPTSAIGLGTMAPPKTPPATASSPFLLRQFAEPEVPSQRPATATREATAAAWRVSRVQELDAAANQRSYSHHRAAGFGWPVAPPRAPDVLDVAAEQEQAALAEEESQADGILQPEADGADGAEVARTLSMMPPPTSPQLHSGQHYMHIGDESANYRDESAEEEELTPPGAPPPPKPPPSRAGGSTTRRALEMEDAARYYAPSSAAQAEPLFRAPPLLPPPVQMSLARARALQANKSDIFGHSASDRAHWTFGPSRR